MMKAMTRNADVFLTILEFSDEMKISERSTRSLIAAGEIRAVRLGKRIVRIPRTEIERLAAVGCNDNANSKQSAVATISGQAP